MKPSSAMDLNCAVLGPTAGAAAGGAAVVWSGALLQADNSASESKPASENLAAVSNLFM